MKATSFAARLAPSTATLLCGVARLVTGARALWQGCLPEAKTRVYFANHSSHGDFVLLWASLPPALRRQTRPVAGADYWLKSGLRRFLVQDVFRAVLVDRTHVARGEHHPVADMGAALEAGESLIVFPEGTRNPEGGEPQAFKSGIYHLSQTHPEIEFVPVWIENLWRVIPKGALIPVPLLCTLIFGAPLSCLPGEKKADFLARARAALVALAPSHD